MATTAIQSSKYFAVDVECVATGTDHNARSVAQVAIVDEHMNLLLELLRERGVPLTQALASVRAVLPRDAVLIGQNIRQDVVWLNLKEGVDFESMQDLQGLYRVWNDKFRSFSVFAQSHLARVLLGWRDAEGPNEHDAAEDARKSMALFNHHRFKLLPDPQAMRAAHGALLAGPVAPSFAKRYATFEGVCMGNRKTCTCGAPFFG
ncbi:hypothetical protein VOLCADRAFT_117954 [Volvox carteri f. nagariensis]|uniref:Exonuclease domain-containing protein n=1 Tax=Volvox carteri f. nagariensis TaxID=3068 RepID=D8TZG4_VOLCA|nr:uncharacterized protein VOLCADRAFT_117954 [Volvox carteri f. nagariensis]EFJ47269.1 hypothetical protein VOLCADRAFT_117954 [Volvox carteri f. nagariensis]|eukprot:XP_002951818.1 hypothetical protein VOLCADRAFT_117954 [Volvox carteri f. nagariensis]